MDNFQNPLRPFVVPNWITKIAKVIDEEYTVLTRWDTENNNAVFRVEIYYYRNRGSWSEYWLIQAKDEEEARSKAIPLTLDGRIQQVKEIDPTEPYLMWTN